MGQKSEITLVLWLMLDSPNKEATMSASLTNIQPTDSGWVLDMTPEMVRVAGVEPGSVIVFYLHDGTVSVFILPAPTDKLRVEVHEIATEFAGAFAEMKRRGD